MTDREKELTLENQKLIAEIGKLSAEIKQIGVNTFLAPFLTAAAVIGATATIVKLFFS